MFGMSAYGYKRTCGGVSDYVRFNSESRHSEAQERFGLKKRTLDVRLAPKSGHPRGWSHNRSPTPKSHTSVIPVTSASAISDHIRVKERNKVFRSEGKGNVQSPFSNHHNRCCGGYGWFAARTAFRSGDGCAVSWQHLSTSASCNKASLRGGFGGVF